MPENLQKPRWMALTPEGDVLVAESRANRIYRLKDADKDGVAESREVFADEGNGLNLPFGMAFSDAHFYVGNTNGVRRYPYTKGQKRLEGKGSEVTSLPGLGYNQHWTRNVRVAPDGKRLFVTVGSESNVDVEESPSRLGAGDGAGWLGTPGLWLRTPQPRGPRLPPRAPVSPTSPSTSAMAWAMISSPTTSPASSRAASTAGPTPTSRRRTSSRAAPRTAAAKQPELVAKTLSPDVLFPAHSAALGLVFYRGAAFPERYRGGAFAAFRGSWNRSEGTGYKIVFVPFDAQGRPTGGFEDFLTGFLVRSQGPECVGPARGPARAARWQPAAHRRWQQPHLPDWVPSPCAGK